MKIINLEYISAKNDIIDELGKIYGEIDMMKHEVRIDRLIVSGSTRGMVLVQS